MSNAASRDAPPGNYAANHADGTLVWIVPIAPATVIERTTRRRCPEPYSSSSLSSGTPTTSVRSENASFVNQRPNKFR